MNAEEGTFTRLRELIYGESLLEQWAHVRVGSASEGGSQRRWWQRWYSCSVSEDVSTLVRASLGLGLLD